MIRVPMRTVDHCWLNHGSCCHFLSSRRLAVDLTHHQDKKFHHSALRSHRFQEAIHQTPASLWWTRNDHKMIRYVDWRRDELLTAYGLVGKMKARMTATTATDADQLETERSAQTSSRKSTENVAIPPL